MSQNRAEKSLMTLLTRDTHDTLEDTQLKHFVFQVNI